MTAMTQSAAAPKPSASPATGVPDPVLPKNAKMLRVPYDHPQLHQTVAFRVGNQCWSATHRYIGTDDATPAGEVVLDYADELKAQEQARAAKAAAKAKADADLQTAEAEESAAQK